MNKQALEAANKAAKHKADSIKGATAQKKSIYFKLGIMFLTLGIIYFGYNIVYMINYIFQSIEYYSSYGYSNSEVITGMLPTVASSLFTPIGIFGCACVSSFGIDSIIKKIK